MNSDYVIQIKTKRGRTWSYVKGDNGWKTASTGKIRPLTVDKLSSHLLPPLAGDQPGLSVSVERTNKRTKTTTPNIR